jgi:hypothetical protein
MILRCRTPHASLTSTIVRAGITNTTFHLLAIRATYFSAVFFQSIVWIFMLLRRSIGRRAQIPLKVCSYAKRQSTLSTTINEENLARYCPGGYHPVRIGDSFKDGAYKIINKLGYGVYSCHKVGLCVAEGEV